MSLFFSLCSFAEWTVQAYSFFSTISTTIISDDNRGKSGRRNMISILWKATQEHISCFSSSLIKFRNAKGGKKRTFPLSAEKGGFQPNGWKLSALLLLLHRKRERIERKLAAFIQDRGLCDNIHCDIDQFFFLGSYKYLFAFTSFSW